MSQNLMSAAKLLSGLTALQLGLIHVLGAAEQDAFLAACLVAVLAPLYSRRFATMTRQARALFAG